MGSCGVGARGGVERNAAAISRLRRVKERFYGPKIDMFVPDALGREWQLGHGSRSISTNRSGFDLEYVNAASERERPVMIHRAMLGSLERFIGVLIEHLGGNLPLWLSPTQAMMVPIADRHNDYAYAVADRMKRSLDCVWR